jgi:hypothetical protein
MLSQNRIKLCCAIQGLFLITLLLSPFSTALAILGEGKESVETDRRALSGQRKTLSHENYTVEVIQGSGIELREYVDANGKIFAVAWTGNQIPDLSNLFGTYFSEHQKALEDARKTVPRRRGPLHLESTHLIVETGGRNPRLWGRAFLPSLIPPGLSREEIR